MSFEEKLQELKEDILKKAEANKVSQRKIAELKNLIEEKKRLVEAAEQLKKDEAELLKLL